MGGGGGPPPPTPVIVGAFICTFAAGLLDATTLLSWTKTTSTHMSGKFLSIGVYIGAADVKAAMYFGMVSCFFLGSFFSGVLTRTPKHKNLWRCAFGIFLVGVGCCLTSVLFLVAGPEVAIMYPRIGRQLAPIPGLLPWYKTTCLAPYMAALTSGFQNGLLTTITGFMRTTHMTGTVTDVGLLCGQAYPTKLKDKAHWWKTRILAGLIGTWSLAGLVAQLLHARAGMGDYLGFLAGGVSFAVSLIGFFYLLREQKAAVKVAAVEAAQNEKARLERQETARLKRQATMSRSITKITAMRLHAGIEALQDMASQMDGNLESMPNPTAKVVATAMNVNRVASNLRGLSSKRLEVPSSEAERDRVHEQVARVCSFLLEQPDLVLQLEKAKGADVGADFLAAWCAQQQAFKGVPDSEEAAAVKVQAMVRGNHARTGLSLPAKGKSNS
uniref:Uncharacterized protein n=1 Tax=Haptolina brevifila TaxID=156173 RepID=A0A7S2IK83_9EUKA|mmetsp:Transcript_66952/g.132697  ORF Transcript_66952/g.132697 Transcript_66952/m.132697 type:complete len:442 (+) Transcript_66952:69-1394(+)